MAVTPLVTPKVAGIHYNDLTQQWHLHASKQEKTGQGIFQPMDKETFATLVDLLQVLLEFWVLAGTNPLGATINAPVGDLAAFGAAMGSMVPMTAALQAPFTPAVPPADLDPGVGDYDGEADSWGATTPP